MLLQLFPTLATTKHLESLLAIDAAMQQIQAKLQQDDQQQHQVIGKGVMHRGISLRQYIRACKHWVYVLIHTTGLLALELTIAELLTTACTRMKSPNE